jgi:urease accessory protein UreF
MTTNAVGATTSADCVWLPPSALTQLADDQLQQAVSGGAISTDDASSIEVSIAAAQNSIAGDNLTAAKNQLGAAVNKVQAAVRSGKISSTDATALIAALNRAIAHM